jgi:calcium uniporter protein, mitochondrial
MSKSVGSSIQLRSRNVPSQHRRASSDALARDLHEKATAEEMEDINSEVEHHKQRQQERPWHREGVDQPPVHRQRSAGAMTKGDHYPTAR